MPIILPVQLSELKPENTVEERGGKRKGAQQLMKSKANKFVISSTIHVEWNTLICSLRQRREQLKEYRKKKTQKKLQKQQVVSCPPNREMKE